MTEAVPANNGSGTNSKLQLEIEGEDFKNAIKNNINIGAPQDQMFDFILNAPERFENVPTHTQNMLIGIAIENLQQTISQLTNLIRSLMQTSRSIINNFRL